jgi:hypothetical protein
VLWSYSDSIYYVLQIDNLSNLSEIDDLASTFAKVCFTNSSVIN